LSWGIEYLAVDAARPLALVVAPIAIVLSVVAWRRSAYRPAILGLELLRLAMIALVLFALFQPERVEIETADKLPKVAVLLDDSLSMQTRDALSGGAVAGGLITRAEWLAANFDLQALRESLAGRYEVVGSVLSSAAVEDGFDPVAQTNMAEPLARLLEDPDLRAIVMLGDGDWNAGGSPAEVAMQSRMKNVPILTSVVGSRTALADIELLPLELPAFALVGKPLSVPYAIKSTMDRDLRFQVTLTTSDEETVTEEVLVAAQSIFEGNLNVNPSEVGTLVVTGMVPVQSGEVDEGNNQASAEIEVREESLRVLLIESVPRWEYRYLRNAMVRDPGVDVDCLLFHPGLDGVGGGPHYIDSFPSKEQLAEYDVVFLGDVGLGPDELSLEECRLIKGLVAEQASGLILMPGLGGRQNSLFETELEPLLPVELDLAAPHGYGSEVAAQLVLTEAGRKSSLTKLAPDERLNADLWDNLPGFQWHAAALRARGGSTVLAVHSSRDDGYGRLPLLATRNFGTGKVLFMGTDGAWRWREGIEDKIHYRFWRQVVRWMAYQRKMNAGESMRLYYTPDRPGVRSLTTLYANVMDAAGAPLAGGDVSVRIESPSGHVSRLNLTADDGEWGLFRGIFRATEPGDHTVVLTCRETGDQLVSTVHFAGAALERTGKPARPEVMAELSRISRGEVLLGSDLSRLEDSLRALEDPPEVARRTRIWSHPLLGAVMILLMACFWTGRKLVGRF